MSEAKSGHREVAVEDGVGLQEPAARLGEVAARQELGDVLAEGLAADPRTALSAARLAAGESPHIIASHLLGNGEESL